MTLKPSHWYESSRALVARKLGACPRCMRASLAIAIAAWIGYGVTLAVTGEPLVHGAALAVAAAFTLLFLAHIGAFYLRARRQWRAGTFVVAPEGDGTQVANRRRFIVTSGAVLGGALLAPLFRVFSAPVLAQSSPARPCDCSAPDPKEPKTPCPSCRCKTNGPPRRPAKPCTKDNKGETTTTSADGTCAGSLKNCGGSCKRTFTWQCEPVNKHDKGFHWEHTGETDSCPTTGAPPNEVTSSKGQCHGTGCKKEHAECGKETTWTCDPHGGEGNNPKGRWTGKPVVAPKCPV